MAGLFCLAMSGVVPSDGAEPALKRATRALNGSTNFVARDLHAVRPESRAPSA